MNTAEELIAALNSYPGDNYWEDVVLDAPGSLVDFRSCYARDYGDDTIDLMDGSTIEYPYGAWEKGPTT